MSEMGHNSGMSPEDAAASMERALAPYQDRRRSFAAKAETAKVHDMESAEAAVDFVRMARALAEKGRELLTETVQPFRDCEAAARSVALRFIEDLEESQRAVNERLSAYNEERRRKAEERAAEQAAVEAELRRKAREAEGEEAAPAPPPPPPPKPRKAPPIRTLTGGRMADQQRFRAKVVDVTKVPEHILNTPRVKEAIQKVAYDMLKNGIEVPGVEREEYNTHSIS